MTETTPKARILLVDDQPAKLLSYEAILGELGEELVKAGSAREALQHLLKGEFAVILVDVCMPEMDGFELAELIRRHPRYRKTAIILVSAVYMSDFDRLRGYDCGAVDYIPVPIIPEVLRAKVSIFVDLYRKNEALRLLNEELGQRVAERTAQLENSAARLRESEERYRAFVATSNEGICCWDFAEPIPLDAPIERQIQMFYQFGSVAECNDVMARMYGRENASDLIGARLAEILPPDQAESADFVEKLVSSGYRVIEAESARPGSDGRIIHRASNLMGIIENDRLLRIWGTHDDITCRKQAEEERVRLLESERRARSEAERSNRLKDEFLAMLSHEMRTPIGSVMGWVQLVRLKRLAPEELDEAFAAIEAGVRAQVRLIDDLLDVTRIASGKLRIERVALDLAQPLRAALDVVTPGAQEKRVTLHATLPSAPLVVEGDPTRLQQIFWNLLDNAIKFTPAEGDVAVDVRVDDAAVVTIRDTGRGIEPEELEHVFGRFWQADRSITRRHGGLGLGLAISRHLIERHGGLIRAESEGRGCGSRFIVTLPLTAGAPLAAQGGAPSDVESDLTGTRILAVDDDPAMREVLSRVLGQIGAQVIAAESADEALAELRRAIPDLLISDIGMPNRDGYGFIREVRGIPGCERLPAIALTAYSGPQDREAALSAGYDAHLVKPVEHHQLLKTIDRVMRPSLVA